MLHWQKKPLSYEICIPPIKHHYYEMTDEEAQAYFDWYMCVLPQRIDYLSKTAAAKLKCDVSTFDLSPESLVPLWRWFISVAEKEPTTVQSEVGNNPYQLSLQTEYILRDIGMYLGKTFIVNDASLYWTIRKHPKTDFFYNRPVVDGFYPYLESWPVFEPIHMAGVQGAKFLTDGKAEVKDLFIVYNHWMECSKWYKSHPCPDCGHILRLNKAFNEHHHYKLEPVNYYCERCKKYWPFSEVEKIPDYLA